MNGVITQENKILHTFIDTNLLWNNKLDMNIFETEFLKDLLNLRDFFELEIESTKIKIILPYTVTRERYKQQLEIFNSEINKTISLLTLLSGNKILKNKDALYELKEIKEHISQYIKECGDGYLSRNQIYSTIICSNEYFRDIVEKAHNKEKPFGGKSDGFKDCIIWYSIIDYLKGQKLNQNDEIFFFTNNKLDFESPALEKEFREIFKRNIYIIIFDPRTMQFYDSSNGKFLTSLLRDAHTIQITGIDIGYTELNSAINCEKIFAIPFPGNLVSLIKTNDINKENFKIILEERVIFLLKNLKFDIKEGIISKNYTPLPIISEITVFLDFHEEGRYYDTLYVEILFDDGDSQEIEIEPLFIPEDCVFIYNKPGDFFVSRIDPNIHNLIVKMIGKKIGRRIDPQLVYYSEEV